MTKNLIANYLGSAAVALSQIVAIPFYVRLLDSHGWGLVSAVLSWAAAALVLETGCTLSVSRHIAMLKGGVAGELGQYVSRMEGRYLSVAASCALTAAILWYMNSGSFQSKELDSTGLGMASLALLFVAAQVAGAVYRGVLVGIGAQMQFNALLGVSAVTKHTVAVLCAWMFSSVGYVVVAMAVCTALEAVARRAVTRRAMEKRISPASDTARILASGWPVALMVASVVGGALPLVDRTFLSARLPPADFGAYAVASMLSMSVLQIIHPVSQALIPRLSEFSEWNSRTLLDRLWIVLLVAVALMLLLFAWMGESLLGWWLSDSVLAAIVFPLLLTHIVGTGLNVLCVPQHVKLLAERKDGRILATNIAAICAQIVALAVLFAGLGALAGAISWILANTVLLVGYWVAKKRR